MITDSDMRDQVARSLDGLEQDDYDIPAIVDELQTVHGTIDIDDIPSDAYWAIVAKHQKG